MHSSILISRLAVHVKEQEEQTVPHLHDYSTCCRHVNSYAQQLPYMYGKRSAHFNMHTTLSLQGLSIHSAHVSTVTVTDCVVYDRTDKPAYNVLILGTFLKRSKAKCLLHISVLTIHLG